MTIAIIDEFASDESSVRIRSLRAEIDEHVKARLKLKDEVANYAQANQRLVAQVAKLSEQNARLGQRCDQLQQELEALDDAGAASEAYVPVFRTETVPDARDMQGLPHYADYAEAHKAAQAALRKAILRGSEESSPFPSFSVDIYEVRTRKVKTLTAKLSIEEDDEPAVELSRPSEMLICTCEECRACRRG